MNYHYNLQSFFKQVTQTFSQNMAIKYDDSSHTYQELDVLSTKFVAFLQSQNINQGSVIAIASTKCFEDYAMMIACLKAGVIYVNLDIENPTKRNESIFSTCHPKKVFGFEKTSSIQECCKNEKIDYLLYQDIKTSTADFIEPHAIDGDSIAYIMFTSGSTGNPKGVAITHDNIIHFINWTTSRYSIKPTDVFANISPMYFDNSVFDFYTSLFSGAALAPIKRNLLTDPINLVKYIDKLQCTIWFSVPSMLIYLTTMRVLNKDTLKSIRIFTFGGEGYPKSELKKLYDIYSNQADIINVYGPTECTCICSSYDIREHDFDNLSELPSLGPINQNFSYVIRDEQGNESKIGELCLLGPNVGVGYFNNPERTEESFEFYTNTNHYCKKMYKTGDLVEEKNDLLYFKGRADNQIKHMGYRIELEEIELALNSIDEIEQAAVIYKREKSAYGKILAFVSSKNTSLEENKIKDKVITLLPTYMIPSKITILEKLPKNQNGKIDRKALREFK